MAPAWRTRELRIAGGTNGNTTPDAMHDVANMRWKTRRVRGLRVEGPAPVVPALGWELAPALKARPEPVAKMVFVVVKVRRKEDVGVGVDAVGVDRRSRNLNLGSIVRVG